MTVSPDIARPVIYYSQLASVSATEPDPSMQSHVSLTISELRARVQGVHPFLSITLDAHKRLAKEARLCSSFRGTFARFLFRSQYAVPLLLHQSILVTRCFPNVSSALRLGVFRSSDPAG